MKWLAILPLIIPCLSISQERCATDYLPENINRTENIQQLQRWITTKRLEKEATSRPNSRATIYTVPVVFHIIHNGEDIGTGTNLSDEKIMEQVAILNQDFRRQNLDASSTLAEFQSVASDTEINFIVAKQDPEGLPTSGITRTLGPKTSYSDDATVLTNVIQWPPEDYINIYVAPLSSSLGFAKFPFSNLEGIDSRFNNIREVDGLFINYKYLGNSDAPGLDFESLGRTATHEMGHYFGLIHIFSGCGTGDYCDDTPSQTGSTSGCPTSRQSCNSEDMFQNYLDYTDDVCMNLFTICQKERMRIILENSPRRKSLLSSRALQDPVVVAVDLGIKQIISPLRSECSPSILPQVELRNYGTTEITSFTVDLYIDNVLIESKTVNSTTMNPMEVLQLSFNPQMIDEMSAHSIEFRVASVNESLDQNASNNSKFIEIFPSEAKILPFLLDFETPVVVQAETETGSETHWAFSTAPNADAQNQAIVLPNFNSFIDFGIKDLFFTDVLDVSNITSIQLNFKYAYAPNSTGDFLDGLIIAISQDCGQTFSYTNYVFEKYGLSLQTADPTAEKFIPTGPDDWESVSLNLTPYLTGSTLQVAFVGINGSGNDLFIDDIEITSAELTALDIGIRDIGNISPVTCRPQVFPDISIKNFGYLPVNAFDLEIIQNGKDTTLTYNGLNIVSGATQIFTNSFLKLIEDRNDFTFILKNLNGLEDQFSPNDTFTTSITLNMDTDVIPLKETFDNSSWLVTERENTPLFEVQELRRNKVLQALAYDSGNVGSKTYLVSPTFNIGNHKKAAIRFKYSYAERPGYSDNLKVFLSINCGTTYSIQILNWSSTDLSINQSLDPWVPITDSDWKTGFIDISEHLIWGNLRIAFVFTNGNGNNLYLDDLEVILNNNPDLPVFFERFAQYPNPATGKFYVALNLPEKETVRIRLIDMSGRMVFDEDFPNTLNQTYELIAPSQKGFYLLQIMGKQVFQYKRIYIQ